MRKIDFELWLVVSCLASILFMYCLLFINMYAGIQLREEQLKFIGEVIKDKYSYTPSQADLQYSQILYVSKVAQSVADAHTYNKDIREGQIFMCGDFSKALVDALKEDGYNASCIFGTYGGQAHIWVTVNIGNEDYLIEATDGQMYKTSDLINSDYKPFYYQSGKCYEVRK